MSLFTYTDFRICSSPFELSRARTIAGPMPKQDRLVEILDGTLVFTAHPCYRKQKTR